MNMEKKSELVLAMFVDTVLLLLIRGLLLLDLKDFDTVG